MKSYFKEWVVVFPGKMGISWKNSQGIYAAPHDRFMSYEEAEKESEKWKNTAVVPWDFWEKYKEYERRTVEAEGRLTEIQLGKFDG